MPRYDYRCRTCDEAFEVSRSISDDAPVVCGRGHAETSRVFTPVAVGGLGTAAAAPASSGGCCGGGCCG